MAISRAQLAKELEPGLNALFGMEYQRYENEHAEIYDTVSSNALSEVSVSKISACSFSYLLYSKPKRAFNPGSNSFANCALEIAIIKPLR